MSLDKAIQHGKERREPYRGSARFDRSCRAHGGGSASPCGYCQGNRLWHAYRELIEAEEQITEFRRGFGEGSTSPREES